MTRRAARGLLLGALALSAAGCGFMFPSLEETVAPVTLPEVGLAIVADLEMWWERGAWLFAFLFGG